MEPQKAPLKPPNRNSQPRASLSRGELSALLYAPPEQQVVYLGIDPGQSGGLARLCRHTAEAYPMPSTLADLYSLLERLRGPGPTYAVLERVSSRPGQGVASTFKFGANYGACKMALFAAGIASREVTPQTWQWAAGAPKRKKGEPQSRHKSRLKGLAKERFPALKVTLRTADALLLAEHARQIYMAISQP
jgi:hypothetical protein